MGVLFSVSVAVLVIDWLWQLFFQGVRSPMWFLFTRNNRKHCIQIPWSHESTILEFDSIHM